jgi:hypothetical protein
MLHGDLVESVLLEFRNDIGDGLIHADDEAILDRTADQHAHHALGHGERGVDPRWIITLEVAFVLDRIPVDDEEGDGGMILQECIEGAFLFPHRDGLGSPFHGGHGIMVRCS